MPDSLAIQLAAFRKPFLLFSLIVISGCQTEERDTRDDAKPLDGGALSRQYCVGCHQYPEPDLLDKNSWKAFVLPRMQNMLGVYPSSATRENLLREDPGSEVIYPQVARLSNKEWEAIEAFYLKLAPERLPQPDAGKSEEGLALFQLRVPDTYLSPPSTTLLQWRADGKLWLGDAHSRTLHLFTPEGQLIRRAKLIEGIVDLRETENELWVTAMGSFSPTDDPRGKLLRLATNSSSPPTLIADQLRRPVDAEYADLTGNGHTDVVVAEYGKWRGRLSLLLTDDGTTYQRTTLIEQTGALEIAIRDFNDDGRPDVLSLFGQGREGFYLSLNEGGGQFSTHEILSFPPSYGSSSFNPFDFDGDGREDIIYTAGDNADFPPIVKPYHGIYVFRNEGEFRFTQYRFWPLPGAYRAIPEDFDQDGDVDLAAISFFPDFATGGQQGFLYLDNQGAAGFKRSHFSPVNLGRWIVLSAMDMDEDGDIDLGLGSLAFEVPQNPALVNTWTEQGIPFVVLENLTIK